MERPKNSSLIPNFKTTPKSNTGLETNNSDTNIAPMTRQWLGYGAAMTRVGRRYSEVSTANSTFNAFTENRGINDSRLFEGDMILNQRQLDRTEHGMDVDSDRKRASIKVGRLWPKGVVVYQIHSSLRMFVYSSFSDLIVICNTKLLKIRNGPKNTKMPLRKKPSSSWFLKLIFCCKVYLANSLYMYKPHHMYNNYIIRGRLWNEKNTAN